MASRRGPVTASAGPGGASPTGGSVRGATDGTGPVGCSSGLVASGPRLVSTIGYPASTARVGSVDNGAPPLVGPTS